MRRLMCCLLLLLLAAPLAAQTSTPGTYTDRWTLSTQPPFVGRIQMAAATTAGLVLQEAATVPNHATRYALAQRVLNEPQFLAVRLAPMTAAIIPVTSTDADGDPATPPIVDTPWTDAQIQTLITDGWDLLAAAFVPAGTPASLVVK